MSSKRSLLSTIAVATMTGGILSGCVASDPSGEAGDETTSKSVQMDTGVTCSGTVLPFYRYYSARGTDHFYTTNFAELGNGASGYALEGTAGELVSSAFVPCGAVPLYRFFNARTVDHFYTTDPTEGAGLNAEGVPGYCFPPSISGIAQSGLIPLLRYFSPGATDHFYTVNFNELGNGASGYRFEGIQCYVAE